MMRILLRCDGGGSLGVGHVMRSLALAEAAVAVGHEVVVAGHFEGPFLGGQLAAAPVEVVELALSVAGAGSQSLVDMVRRQRPDVIHVDSYDDTRPFADVAVSAGVEAVISNMEDGTFGRRPADVVIDPTVGAELSARPDDGSTWVLRGSRYAPLRQKVIDFSRWGKAANGTAGKTVRVDVARRVLVVMGGTDPVGLAPAAVELLAETGLALDVTAIAAGQNAERVRAAARGSHLSLDVLAPVNDLAMMMSEQDLVISAAGTSVLELCCIGVPTALTWAVDNQREGYDRVVAAGAALGLGGPGWADADERAVHLLTNALTDPQVRADLVRAGQQLVDGLGAWRVVRTWEQARRPHSVVADRAVVVRPATIEDARQLWEWRNDAGTRAGSRSSEMVPWPQHLAWMESSLTRKDRVLLVVQDASGPLGTVRWDLETAGQWEVSITVAPDRRGQSLAGPLLRAAEVALSGETDVSAYLAVVHVDNAASVGLFETSAYVPDLPPDPQGFMRFRKDARVA
jgi:spore coat polysaccharide biosynthesis predicted glycosyltransferase SpsG/RimJ/RimL family protein N-acetyltransferase